MDAVVKYADREVVFCDAQPQDYIEGMLLQGRWYELPNLEFIRNLQAGDGYVDVGAYIGTHSLFFSLFCAAEQVYAFEPQLDVYRKLVRNLAVNNASKCQAINMGLSDMPGRGFARGSDINKGGAWLLPGDAVDVVTLDSLNLPNIRLMKIDVEGMELRLLRGARDTLRGVEHLFVEMWPENKGVGIEYTAEKVVEFLRPLGFKQQNKLEEDLFYFGRG